MLFQLSYSPTPEFKIFNKTALTCQPLNLEFDRKIGGNPTLGQGGSASPGSAPGAGSRLKVREIAAKPQKILL